MVPPGNQSGPQVEAGLVRIARSAAARGVGVPARVAGGEHAVAQQLNEGDQWGVDQDSAAAEVNRRLCMDRVGVRCRCQSGRLVHSRGCPRA
jgi:hypothetical protein